MPDSPEVYSKIRAEDLQPSEVEDYFVGIRPGQVFFSYWRCIDCGLLYCPKYFNSNQLQAAYAKMPDNSMGNSLKVATLNQSRYADWILKRKPNSTIFLELGPDLGLLSRLLVSAWRPKKAIFVEPNEDMHKTLSEISGADEVLIQANIEEPLESSGIDAVVGVHVFDHLINPLAKLQEICEKSSNDSQIFFVVHNEKSILRFILGRKFPPFCLQHPQLFSPKTVKLLLRSSGWDLQKTSRTVNSFNVQNQLQMLMRILGLGRLQFKNLSRLVFTAPLGNFIAQGTRSKE